MDLATLPPGTTDLIPYEPPNSPLPQLHALYSTLHPSITQESIIATAKLLYGPGSLRHIAPPSAAPPKPKKPSTVHNRERWHERGLMAPEEDEESEEENEEEEKREGNVGMMDLPQIIDYHRERLLEETMERRAKQGLIEGVQIPQSGPYVPPEYKKRYLSPLFFVVDHEDWEHDGVWVVDVSACERAPRKADGSLVEGEVSFDGFHYFAMRGNETGVGGVMSAGETGDDSEVMIRRFYPDDSLGEREEEREQERARERRREEAQRGRARSSER